MAKDKSKPANEARPSDFFLSSETLSILKNRDSVFLGKLFSDVNPYLNRVCMANGIYEADAEEVIYDTWEKFFTNLNKFEGRSQIRTFICGILFNKIRELTGREYCYHLQC